MNRCSASLVIRNMQRKTVSYHFTLVYLAYIEKPGNAGCEDVRARKAGEQAPVHIAGEGWCGRSGQHLGLFLDAHPGGSCRACRGCVYRRQLPG